MNIFRPPHVFILIGLFALLGHFMFKMGLRQNAERILNYLYFVLFLMTGNLIFLKGLCIFRKMRTNVRFDVWRERNREGELGIET